MSEYVLQTLRLDHVFDTRQDAVAWLDTFPNHRLGQLISLVYKTTAPNNEEITRALFAVGNADALNGETGPEYYTIINSENDIVWNEITL